MSMELWCNTTLQITVPGKYLQSEVVMIKQFSPPAEDIRCRGGCLCLREEWSILHNVELADLYCSLNIIRVIKKRRMRWARACSMYGGIGEVRTGFWWGNLREGDHLEDPGVDGRIILRWIFRKWNGDMEWIDMAQDRDRWRAFVKAVMNL